MMNMGGFGGGMNMGGGNFRGGRGGGGGMGKKRKRGGVAGGVSPLVMQQMEQAKLEEEFGSRGVPYSAIRTLVAPKPPIVVLVEMVGKSVDYVRVPNPPLPPDQIWEGETMVTVEARIDGDCSTGTGPNLFVAKNICAENAIMKVVEARYQERREKMREMSSDEANEFALRDETSFQLASIALYKMFNEWMMEEGWYPPREIEELMEGEAQAGNLPAADRFSAVCDRLAGILPEGEESGTPCGSYANFPMHTFEDQSAVKSGQANKNPLVMANELAKQPLLYNEISSVFVGGAHMFTIGVTYNGETYSGTDRNKKEAKRKCAMELLTKAFGIDLNLHPLFNI